MEFASVLTGSSFWLLGSITLQVIQTRARKGLKIITVGITPPYGRMHHVDIKYFFMYLLIVIVGNYYVFMQVLCVRMMRHGRWTRLTVTSISDELCTLNFVLSI